MMRAQRIATSTSTSTPSTKQQYLQAKNQYSKRWSRRKRDHWNDFLTNNDLKSIFKAMLYTKDKRIERIPAIKTTTSSTQLAESFSDKATAFRTTLFPKLPTTQEPN